MVNFTHLFLFLVGFPILTKADSDSGPVGPIIIHDFMQCEENINEVDFKVESVTGEDKRQMVTFSFTNPMDIDAEARVMLRGHKFHNGDWERDSYTVDDKPFLKLMNDFIPAIWEDFRNEAQPNVPTPDIIPADSYEVVNLHAEHTDVTAPSIFYGRYMGEATVTVDDQDILCVGVEIEFKPPGSM